MLTQKFAPSVERDAQAAWLVGESIVGTRGLQPPSADRKPCHCVHSLAIGVGRVAFARVP